MENKESLEQDHVVEDFLARYRKPGQTVFPAAKNSPSQEMLAFKFLDEVHGQEIAALGKLRNVRFIG